MNELRVTVAGQTYGFGPGQTVRIGRGPDNAVVVSDPVVSRQHAQVRWEADGWVLDDLGKGRTFVGGLPVSSVAVQQPLNVHLANPLGPELRIELRHVGQPGDGRVSWEDVPASGRTGTLTHIGGDEAGHDGHDPRHPSAVHRTGLWRGDISASRTSPVYGPARHHHARGDSPGGDFATAVHILLPIRSWLKDPGWKQGSRLLVIAYGLLPSLFVVLFSATTNVNVPGWAYSLAIAPLWAVAFWLLIRPGRITRLIAWMAVGIIAAVLVLLPTLTLPWENALDNTQTLRNVLPWIYGVGIAEEVTKALPILVAALALRWVWKLTLDVRVWMFLGTISGLAFGVRESVLYTSSYLMQGTHKIGAGFEIPLILSFAQRVFVDGFQHAVWAGIAAFFIGMGVNYRRRRIPLILFGVTLPAVLHGLNDWSTQLAAHWLWIVMEAVSLLLFIGYTMSAATIERQVRDTPLFRGESMIMDRIVVGGGDQPAKP
ncbi:MAG TPA: PrsW family glutamic-type intramembrane protease [Streptosporangiaceae bacterium]|nr:PrsW family glutamic-type intramembrane protease [Streptosporangiaceae bacterium]